MENRGRVSTRSFLIIGIAVALLIGIAAVFLAAGGPDGLESAALVIRGQKTLTGPAPEGAGAQGGTTGGVPYSAPMPDYTLGLVKGPLGGIIAIMAGTILACLAVFGSLKVMKILSRRRTRPQDREP